LDAVGGLGITQHEVKIVEVVRPNTTQKNKVLIAISSVSPKRDSRADFAEWFFSIFIVNEKTKFTGAIVVQGTDAEPQAITVFLPCKTVTTL
jgi:hypothetical protein